MSKIDWSVYSARRRINPARLVEAQIIKSYEDFLAYCESVNVNPPEKSDFNEIFGSYMTAKAPVKSAPESKEIPKAPPMKEPAQKTKPRQTSKKKSTRKAGTNAANKSKD